MFGLPTKAIVYAAIAAAVLALLGGLYAKGRIDANQKAAVAAAAQTINNLETREAIDASVADASKDEMCRKLGAKRWVEEQQECVSE